MRGSSDPVGVLLAGGLGRRLGGDKARVALAGRPLAQWAIDALTAALDDVVVACRLDTELPELRGVCEAWVEPDGPRGAVAGVAAALREARGRPIIACSLALPLVTPEVVTALARATGFSQPVVAPEVGGRLEARIARWEQRALPVLEGLPPNLALEAAANALGAAVIVYPGGDPAFTHIDVPEDLLLAASLVEARRKKPRAVV